MTGLVIFGLLCLLMITGMPISIALGLTVLTFLFTMTQVPLESVALKLFTGIIGTFGAHFVWELMHTDQVSADLELPKWLVYLCIPLGSFLMCYRFLQVCWSFHKTGHLPHADHGHVEGLDKEAEVEWAVMPSDLHPADVKPGKQP